MSAEQIFEARLRTALAEPMNARERAWLDERIAGLLEGKRRRSARRLRLTRSLVLVGALFILVPTVFGVAASLRSSEAPYGMMNATQYEAELQAAKAVTPLPPGATWGPWLDRAPDPSASYGVGLGRETVEFNAYCLWLGEWYVATDAGMASRATAARTVIDTIPSWRTFSDPATMDEGGRAYVRELVASVDRGDREPVFQELTSANCSSTWGGGK